MCPSDESYWNKHRKSFLRCKKKYIHMPNPFGSLASKDFPSGYSKSVCVRLHSENSEPTMWFSQTTPDEHNLRRHRTALRIDGQLSSLYAPSPSFSSFGAACDVLFRSSCLFERTLTARSVRCPSIGLVVNIMYIRRFWTI